MVTCICVRVCVRASARVYVLQKNSDASPQTIRVCVCMYARVREFYLFLKKKLKKRVFKNSGPALAVAASNVAVDQVR